MIYTFWEGRMYDYIRLCLSTWRLPHIILNYDNLHHYTGMNIEPFKRFSLAQQADAVRVHALRDQGGYWLDADTIMLSDKLPTANMIGYPRTRQQTIGYLHADQPGLQLFRDWAQYQDTIAADPDASHHWSIMGNAFTDPYCKEHPEVTICDVDCCWPERDLPGNASHMPKYLQFYFKSSYTLRDFRSRPKMLMLHNSWTPGWYKDMTTEEVLKYNCTLSNILRELTA